MTVCPPGLILRDHRVPSLRQGDLFGRGIAMALILHIAFALISARIPGEDDADRLGLDEHRDLALRIIRLSISVGDHALRVELML